MVKILPCHFYTVSQEKVPTFKLSHVICHTFIIIIIIIIIHEFHRDANIEQNFRAAIFKIFALLESV